MNADYKSPDFGQIKAWDELTEEEKASGKWIKLPDGVRWTNSPETAEEYRTMAQFEDLVKKPDAETVVKFPKIKEPAE